MRFPSVLYERARVCENWYSCMRVSVACVVCGMC